jgi:hypothetical protein
LLPCKLIFKQTQANQKIWCVQFACFKSSINGKRDHLLLTSLPKSKFKLIYEQTFQQPKNSSYQKKNYVSNFLMFTKKIMYHKTTCPTTNFVQVSPLPHTNKFTKYDFFWMKRAFSYKLWNSKKFLRNFKIHIKKWKIIS